VTCDMNAAIEKVQKAGIEVMGGFILGFDTDTDDVFDNQLGFIRRNSMSRVWSAFLPPCRIPICTTD